MNLKEKYRNAEISTKITLTYTACFIFLLIIINFVMYFGVYYALYRPAGRSIKFSMESVKNLMDTLAQNPHAFNPDSIREPLVAGVILRAIGDDGYILADTDAHYISNEDFNENIISNPSILADKNMEVASIYGALIYRAKMDYTFEGEHVSLYFFRTITSEKELLDSLTNLLMLLDIFGIIFALAFGNMTSKKILKPIKIMTEHAKKIAFGKMDGRITIPPANDELTALAKTFNEMLDRLQGGFKTQEKLITRQQKFVSDASHELRNPATVILGYTDILARYGVDDAEIFNESIAAIRSESQNMKNLLENLLFLARTDQNRQKLKKQKLELSAIVDDIMKKMIRTADKHCVKLLKNDFAQIFGDETTIRQMIRIFLDNAVKYTPAGGNISVASENFGGAVKLKISDTGIGIAPENLDKIFDRFFRGDKARVNDGDKISAGLGLSIAKWIADIHGAKIEVESELGGGTIFKLTFRS